MSYTTLKIMFTRGDRATQPGGLILRRCDNTGKLVTHRFNRDLNSTQPREFYWGHYFDPSNPGYEARASRRLPGSLRKLRAFRDYRS